MEDFNRENESLNNTPENTNETVPQNSAPERPWNTEPAQPIQKPDWNAYNNMQNSEEASPAKQPEVEAETKAEEPKVDETIESTPEPKAQPEPQPAHNSAPNQNPNGYSYNQNSGEYRYIPPYQQGGYQQGSYRPQPPHNMGGMPPRPPMPPRDETPNKKRKKGRAFSTAAIVLLLLSTVVISFGAGMLGSFAAEELGYTDSTKIDAPAADGAAGDNNVVIYKSPAESDMEKTDLTDVSGLVSKSVVEISTEFQKTYGNFQYVNGGAGSGVIISTDGYVITNNHVVTDEETGKVADTVTVRLSNGEEYDAQIVGCDSDSDIAVLKIEAKDLTAAVLGNSSELQVGQQIIAVGNPLGELGGTVTTGIISATNREITVDNNKMNLIQIDAAINPGNSGGGLFNLKGELVGIVNAKSTGSGVEGLGFAIPIDDASYVAESLITNGYVGGKTYIGVSLSDITDSFSAFYYFRSQSTGVYVTQVQEGYNDEVLKYGDRITAIDDKEISSSADVKSIIKEHKVGDELTFSLIREGMAIDVNVTLYEEYVPESGVSFDKGTEKN